MTSNKTGALCFAVLAKVGAARSGKYGKEAARWAPDPPSLPRRGWGVWQRLRRGLAKEGNKVRQERQK
jgi:hypothetical protein